jgi:hypothetical protein
MGTSPTGVVIAGDDDLPVLLSYQCIRAVVAVGRKLDRHIPHTIAKDGVEVPVALISGNRKR